MKIERRKMVMDPGGASIIYSDRRRPWGRLEKTDRRKQKEKG